MTRNEMDVPAVSLRSQATPLASTGMLTSHATLTEIRSKLTATGSKNIIHATKWFLEGIQELQSFITGPKCNGQTAQPILDIVEEALEHIWYRVCAASVSKSTHGEEGALIERQFAILGSLLDVMIYHRDALGSHQSGDDVEEVLEDGLRRLYKLLTLLWCHRLCLQWIITPSAALTHPLPNCNFKKYAEEYLSQGSDEQWTRVLIELREDPREGSESEGVFGELLLSELPEHERSRVVTSRHQNSSEVSPRPFCQLESTSAPTAQELEAASSVAIADLTGDCSKTSSTNSESSSWLTQQGKSITVQDTGSKHGRRFKQDLELHADPDILRLYFPPGHDIVECHRCRTSLSKKDTPPPLQDPSSAWIILCLRCYETLRKYEEDRPEMFSEIMKARRPEMYDHPPALNMKPLETTVMNRRGRPGPSAESTSILKGADHSVNEQEQESMDIELPSAEVQDVSKDKTFGWSAGTPARHMTDLEQEEHFHNEHEAMDVDLGPTRQNGSSSEALALTVEGTPGFEEDLQEIEMDPISAKAQESKGDALEFTPQPPVEPFVGVPEPQECLTAEQVEKTMDIDSRSAEVQPELSSKVASDPMEALKQEFNFKQQKMDIDLQPAEVKHVEERSQLDSKATAFASSLHVLRPETKSCKTGPEEPPVVSKQLTMREKRPFEERTLCSAVGTSHSTAIRLYFELSQRNLDWVQLGGMIFPTLERADNLSMMDEVATAAKRWDNDTPFLSVCANGKTMISWKPRMPTGDKSSDDDLNITPYVQIGMNIIQIGSVDALMDNFEIAVVSA